MDDKEYLKGFVTGVLFMLIIAASAFFSYQFFFNTDDRALNKSSKRKIELIEDMVDNYYLEEINVDNMEEGLYAGIVAGLGDVYSRYYTAEQYEEITKENDGAYVGIGVVLQQNPDNSVEIVECYKGAPGEMAGLLVGDVLKQIDGKDISAMELSDIVQMIQETAGEHVNLVIQRPGENDSLEFTVQIRNVEMQHVFHEMYDEEIGYIAITEFSGVTYKQYEAAFTELKNAGMKKLIVDLRENPGGLYTSVCEVLDEILPEGVIVYTEDKYGNREESLSDEDAPFAVEMAVLVNGESASAAEIFAGAIQDYAAGTIVGTTTYGKGVVQSIYRMKDGSALKLTVSKYYTPDGNGIHGVGIEPDVIVELDNTRVAEEVEITEKTAEEDQRETAIQEEKNKWDNQVEAAAEILTSMQ